jgi:hypothetical protein
MRLDLRYPIGILFLIYGVILAGYGLISSKEIYQRSLNINVNLSWGVVMLVFGALMFLAAKLGAKRSNKK